MSRKKTHQGVEIRNTFGMRSIQKLKTWVVLMDRSRARVYEWPGSTSDLELIKSWDFPLGKVRGSELVWDQPGRVFDSKTFSRGGHQTATPRHSYGSKIKPKTLLALKSVRTVVDWVEKNKKIEKVDDVVCVAEPGLLGVIQKQMQSKYHEVPQKKWDKDFSWLEDKALEARLVSWLSGKTQTKKRMLPKSLGAFGPKGKEVGYGS